MDVNDSASPVCGVYPSPRVSAYRHHTAGLPEPLGLTQYMQSYHIGRIGRELPQWASQSNPDSDPDPVRVNQCRHIIFLAGLSAQAAGFVAVVSIVPDHLLVLAGDMCGQLREPINKAYSGCGSWLVSDGECVEGLG